MLRNVLVVSAMVMGLCHGQAFTSLSDVRRGQLLSTKCSEIAALGELVSTPATSVPGDAGMTACNGMCHGLYPGKHQQYMFCYSCCDTYYGQTQRTGEQGGPLLPKMHSGKISAPVAWSSGVDPNVVTCKAVVFPTPYPEGSRLHVMVTPTYDSALDTGALVVNPHDPRAVWTSSVTATGFTACHARSGPTFNAAQAFASFRGDEALNYAVITEDDGFQGISGVRAEPAFSGVKCTTLPFGKRFEEPPVVVITPDIAGDQRVGLLSWLTGVTTTSFTYCFSTPANRAADGEAFAMNWIAIQQGINCPGRAQSFRTQGVLTRLSSVSTTRCQRIPFPVGFPASPLVQLSVISQGGPVAHWVEGTAEGDTVVCVSPDFRATTAVNPSRIIFQVIARDPAIPMGDGNCNENA
jgi:hypothetical protein